MLSRQRVPCGKRVLMLVNWVEGTKGQSFSFLSASSSELWGGEPKSPRTTSSFSPTHRTQRLVGFSQFNLMEDARTWYFAAIVEDWPRSVSWMLGERWWALTSSVLLLACTWMFTTVSSHKPSYKKKKNQHCYWWILLVIKKSVSRIVLFFQICSCWWYCCWYF